MTEPICATAASSSAMAIETKMSLKPVISRKLSSSTRGLARDAETWSRNLRASSGESAPAATALSISVSLYILCPPIARPA